MLHVYVYSLRGHFIYANTTVSTLSSAPSTSLIDGLQQRINLQPTHMMDMEVFSAHCPSGTRYSAFRLVIFNTWTVLCNRLSGVQGYTFSVSAQQRSKYFPTCSTFKHYIQGFALPGASQLTEESRLLIILWHLTPINLTEGQALSIDVFWISHM